MSRAKLMTDAIDAFVVGCKADGIWDSIKACCILAGWDGLAGALTPIKGAAPTNVNFVSGDYNRKRGLASDGSTKYLNTNRANNADPQNSNHNAVYSLTAPTSSGAAIGSGFAVAGSNAVFGGGDVRNRSTTIVSPAVSAVRSGFIGAARNSSSDFVMRYDGATSASGSNPAQTPDSNALFVFRRNDAGSPAYYNGRLGFYSIGESLDLALLDSRVSTLLTSIWRAVHPEFTVVNNPDAMDWIGRVYDAGGSVSVSTANAVNTFCNAIDSAGIRSKFLRLNLFAGNDLTSALVPLYRSSAYGGAVVGGATDTNNNFVSADYAETGASGGLLGNGTTKYLNTGLAPNAAPSTATGHLSAWTRGGSVSGTRRLLGAEETVVANRFTLDRRLAAGGGDGFQWGSLGSGNNTDDDTAGLISGSRVSATDSRFYKNGTQVGTTQAASATVTAHSNPWYVFASNQNGTAGTYYERRLAAYSIGGEMTASQMANYYTAMLAFQTALGRQA